MRMYLRLRFPSSPSLAFLSGETFQKTRTFGLICALPTITALLQFGDLKSRNRLSYSRLLGESFIA